MTEIQQAYLTLHKASGFKVGDKVRIIRPFYENELGCSIHWDDKMKKEIGNIKPITRITPCSYEVAGWCYPFFVLELVEKAKAEDRIEWIKAGTFNKANELMDNLEFGCRKGWAEVRELLIRLLTYIDKRIDEKLEERK